jgi:hypothetical protein
VTVFFRVMMIFGAFDFVVSAMIDADFCLAIVVKVTYCVSHDQGYFPSLLRGWIFVYILILEQVLVSVW